MLSFERVSSICFWSSSFCTFFLCLKCILFVIDGRTTDLKFTEAAMRAKRQYVYSIPNKKARKRCPSKPFSFLIAAGNLIVRERKRGKTLGRMVISRLFN